MKTHAYDAANRCIHNAYRCAKHFRRNRKACGYSRHEMRKHIAENLKTFYEVGIEYPNSVERYRQHARKATITHDSNDIIGHDKNGKPIWGVNFKHRMTNCIENAIMFLRLKRIINFDSELRQLSKKYKSMTVKSPKVQWVVTEY